MSCEETKQLLSLYVDNALMLPARVAVDEHVDKCPVCRDEFIELRALTRGLSMLSSSRPPVDLAASITSALMIEAAARRQSPKSSFGDRLARFLEPRLMPTALVLSLRSFFLSLCLPGCDPTLRHFTKPPCKVPQSMWFPRAPVTI
ncbi:MAG: zf-HC2 domain-containing protein [Pyrinomonadaceae bacterium]|nr:zf-HC2 domain-containing protein [Pyrinomonadaceae bacterium]